MSRSFGRGNGFTLIELSIVLVIIGLLVGGVMVGRDLISAAAIRAQIGQIDQYDTAIYSFEDKYGCLPGDCANAAQFGFAPRGTGRGEGDGNGVLESQGDAAVYNGSWQGNGEVCGFWRDLSQANLIAGDFNYCALSRGAAAGSNYQDVQTWLPAAKIGNGNYVTVYSGGQGIYGQNGINYFGVSKIDFAGNWVNTLHSPHEPGKGMTVQQAYNIDTKMDDGFPQTGRVQAVYLTCAEATWANDDLGSQTGTGGNGPANGVATPPSATTCYDDRGVTGAARQYSTQQNNGGGVNCGLSFQFP